ncbi:MAG: hypothetical protein EZS28_029756 [Streblomastix strix]|uniref:Hemerythrin-like domain-containing protein n=1 Tax=Streblomastix strix TaxID=222440 RepID=A0A5J4UVM0_9EUKA|nr:MAG: hypothetical protein EZS28_029756 [Streblomastix strix]
MKTLFQFSNPENIKRNDPTFAFLSMGIQNDLSRLQRAITNQVIDALNSSINYFQMINLITLLLQTVLYFLTFLIVIIPLRSKLKKISEYTIKLHKLIPDDAYTEIIFDKSLASGYEKLDTGESKIIDLILLVVDCIQNQNMRDIRSLTTEIQQSVKQHFMMEENLMHEVKFPHEQRDLHMLEHIRLRQRLTIICDNFNSGQRAQILGSLNYFRSFIQDHFVTYDKPFGDYIKKATGEFCEEDLEIPEEHQALFSPSV